MSVDTMNASGVFRVGDVMSRAWRLFTGNILFFLLVPVVIYVVMTITMVIFFMVFGLAGWASGSMALVWIAIGLTFVLVLGFTMLGQGIQLLGAFQRLRGQPLRVGDVLQRVFARIVPLLAIGILLGVSFFVATVIFGFVFAMVAVALGPLALVLTPLIYVPAAFLLVLWAVVVPACVVEGLGPIGSMSRSAELTKGYRWKIFGITLLLGLLMLLGFGLQLILTLTIGQGIGSLFSLVFFVVWIAYWNCAVIMTYHDLRVAKEGIDTEQIASIFD